MSKSLGNFFALRDLLAKGFTGREIRFLLLTAHYRETFNFTLEGLVANGSHCNGSMSVWRSCASWRRAPRRRRARG